MEEEYDIEKRIQLRALGNAINIEKKVQEEPVVDEEPEMGPGHRIRYGFVPHGLRGSLRYYINKTIEPYEHLD